MTFCYLEHGGDEALEASGATLEEAFGDAARGMCALMVRRAPAVGGRDVEIKALGETLEELLLSFLNGLLTRQSLEDLLFTGCAVREIVRGPGGGWALRGTATGVSPELEGVELGHEVKGVSLLGLAAESAGGRSRVRCVLDL